MHILHISLRLTPNSRITLTRTRTLPSAHRYFFHLLRHDIFGELKDVFRILIEKIEKEPRLIESSSVGPGSLRAATYPGAYVKGAQFSPTRGLMATISFPLLYIVLNMPPSKERSIGKQTADSRVVLFYAFYTLTAKNYTWFLHSFSQRHTSNPKRLSMRPGWFSKYKC